MVTIKPLSQFYIMWQVLPTEMGKRHVQIMGGRKPGVNAPHQPHSRWEQNNQCFQSRLEEELPLYGSFK